MKTTYLTAAIGSLLLLGDGVSAQEGNSAYRDILENKHTQDILRTLKNDPEAAARAAQSNSDDLIRNAMGAFAETQKKKDPNAVSATRSTRPPGEKALSNINKLLASPVSNSQQALPVPVDEIKNFKVDSSKIDRLKSVAKETIPELSNILPDDPQAKPKITGVPKLPDLRAARPEPKKEVAAINSSSPLNVSPQMAPPPPLRDMQPTVPQIPDSPELFSSDVPAPRALAPRYPKPEKFRSPAATKGSPDAPKPKSDTMVITSNESEMDRNSHLLTFHGDVEVEMDGLNLTCDHMVVHLDKDDKMEKIVATGGTVQIMKTGENGQPQLSKSRKAEYIAATKTATLSGGPPYLQNGDQYVNTDSEDSVIVLGGDGKYKVHSPKSSGGRTVIVVPISNTKNLTGDLGIENKLKR